MPIHCKAAPIAPVPCHRSASPIRALLYRFRASCCHPSPRPAPLCLSCPVLCPVIASPRRALPQPRASWPCSSFANAASQIYAFPWRVSSSLIHGHAPLAELFLRSVFPCYSFAMQCLSVPSRLVSKLCRSVSRLRPPNLRGPTPKQINAFPSRPGGAPHRSSRIS